MRFASVVGMPVPQLSSDDREAAAAAAIAARRHRAEIKAAVTSGELSLAEILDRLPDDAALAKMRVLELLEAVPGLGPVRARKVLDRLGIAHSRRLRGLGVRQRAMLKERFGES